jgi:CheY-like chemotaxis protein
VENRKRVLIVDDEFAIAYSLAAIFSNEGYDSKAAYSAEQAVQMVSEWVPDLAIVDIRLKEADGVDLAIRLREEFPSCEVALFTGLIDLGDLLQKAHDAGHSFQIIPKPSTPAEMIRIAAQMLSGLGEMGYSPA